MKNENLNLIYTLLRKYFYRYRLKIILTLVIILTVSMVSMGLPYISKYIIDDIIPAKNIALLIFAALLYFVLTLISSVLGYYQEIVMIRLNFLVLITMRRDLVKRIHNMPMQEYYRQSGSYIFNRIQNDTIMVLESFMATVIRMCNEVVQLLVAIVLLAMLNIYLTIAVVLLLLLNAWLSHYWGSILAKQQAVLLEHYTKHNSSLQEAVMATFLVKIYDLHYKFAKRLFASFRKYYKLYASYVLKSYSQGAYALAIREFCYVLILVGGGIAIIHGKLTFGGLFAFITIFQMIRSPLALLVQNIINFRKNIPLYGRLRDYLNLESEFDQHNGSKITINKEIEFRDVCFAYQVDSPVITNFSHILKPGIIYMLSGNSGTGKTTLAMMLMGIYAPIKGEILVDGNILSKAYIHSMRQQSSYVEQEPFVIDDTIYQNILLGNPKASEDEVYRISALANVSEFVAKLPDKYNTLLGANGINLSTGQKQRIAIARGLLKYPRLLILDEPTSNIDSASEALIHETIRNLPKDMFIIIISHKAETRQIVDEVIEI